MTQTRGVLTPDARLRIVDGLSHIVPGAKLHTYVTGTPATPLATYNDADLAIGHENANPIVASAGGLFGPIYLTPGAGYKFVLTDANDVTIWTQDPIVVGALGPAINVLDYGADPTGVADSTVAIQAAIDAGLTDAAPVFIPSGTYKITDTLRTYPLSPLGPGAGLVLLGAGMYNTQLHYFGPSNQSVIRMIGSYQELRDLLIQNSNGVGWLAGVDYDGDVTIGDSAHSVIRNVSVQNANLTGDGIGICRSGRLADSLEIDHANIAGCLTGSAIVSYGGTGQVPTLEIIAPTIAGCHAAVLMLSATATNISGGWLSTCDFNFVNTGGGPMLIAGVRSGNCKRSFWSAVGSAQQPVTFQSYHLASINTTRPATTGAVANGSTALTLSVAGFIAGDRIVIAGAGIAAAALHCQILSSVTTAVVIDTAASTTVTVAAVTLDATVPQQDFFERSAGPYTHIGCFFQAATGAAASPANGPQVWIGNTWTQNVIDPYGTPLGTAGPNLPSCTMLGNTYNLSTNMANRRGALQAQAFAANATTPSVVGGDSFITANAAGTTITNFTDGYGGQIIHVMVNDANTTFATSATLKLGTSPLTGIQNTVYTFLNIAGVWYVGATI